MIVTSGVIRTTRQCISLLLYQAHKHQRKPLNVTDLGDMVAPILAVLSKGDYGDVVSVVLDVSDVEIQGVAKDLRDAGARVRPTEAA